ncbi:MAG: hypothetical protein QME60_08220 [Verrucomicrobiota bacterium]|nr:hypothetical protein [Verrucomicrobiota bacterium]
MPEPDGQAQEEEAENQENGPLFLDGQFDPGSRDNTDRPKAGEAVGDTSHKPRRHISFLLGR